MIKAIGEIWIICIILGVLTGGVGLFATIPMAVVLSVYIIWIYIKGEKPQFSTPVYHWSSGARIEDLDTMEIPSSGYSAEERAAEYRRRRESPSGVIDGIYSDLQRPDGVPYSDVNRDWDANA